MSAPDWDALIAAAEAARLNPRVAITHAGGFTSATRPQKFICDNGELYVVKFSGNNHGDGRGIFTEQVVALAGRLIGAPVAVPGRRGTSVAVPVGRVQLSVVARSSSLMPG